MSSADYREACGERSRSRSRTPPRACSRCGTHLVQRRAVKLSTQQAWRDALDVTLWGQYSHWQRITKKKTQALISTVPNRPWSVAVQLSHARKQSSEEAGRLLNDATGKLSKLENTCCFLDNVENVWELFSSTALEKLSCRRCCGAHVSIKVIEKDGNNQGKALIRCTSEKCKALRVDSNAPESLKAKLPPPVSLMSITGGKRSGIVYDTFAPMAMKERGVLRIKKESLIDLLNEHQAQRAAAKAVVERLRLTANTTTLAAKEATDIADDVIKQHVHQVKQRIIHSRVWMRCILYARARVAARRVLIKRVDRWASSEYERAQQILDCEPCLCGQDLNRRLLR